MSQELLTCREHGEWIIIDTTSDISLDQAFKCLCSVCKQRLIPVPQGDLVWVMPLYKGNLFRGTLTCFPLAIDGFHGRIHLEATSGKVWDEPFLIFSGDEPLSIDITAEKDGYEVPILSIPLRVVDGKLVVDPPENVQLEVKQGV